jgi:hypothetical protein
MSEIRKEREGGGGTLRPFLHQPPGLSITPFPPSIDMARLLFAGLSRMKNHAFL